MTTRRTFLKALGLGGLGAAGAGAFGFAAETTDTIVVNHVAIPVSTLPAAFDGYTIGFVSDMHLGYYVSTELIARSADLLREARCDLIALGGDYIWLPDDDKIWPKTNTDFRTTPHSEMPARVFSRIADIYASLNPPDGVVAVLGNHDGWIDPSACLAAFAARQITVLENRTVEIRRGEELLTIGGVADLWTGFPALPRIRPKSAVAAAVLLAHNPDFIAELLQKGPAPFDLALAGHTHGGQIRLPFVGAVFDNVDDKRFVSGLAPVAGGAVYTSNGLGVVEIPLRINCPPEVTVVRLERSIAA